MKRPHIFATSILFVMGLLAPQVLTAQDSKVDVSGKWLFSVTTDAGTGSPKISLKQQGDSLTGHYSSQTLGEADLKGTVKEGKIDFHFTVDIQGTSIVVTYSGTVDSKDAMKGTLDLGGQATGTFTAKRE